MTEPLWAFLDDLHPHLWRQGRDFPKSGPAQVQMLNDGVLDMALSFYPSQASGLIKEGRLPESVRTFVFDAGMIGNTHFVAIPYNAAHKAGAMVVANFLMSPEAQAHKARPDVWGDQTVLDVDELPADQRRLFQNIDRGKATLGPRRTRAHAAGAAPELDDPDRTSLAEALRQLERDRRRWHQLRRDSRSKSDGRPAARLSATARARDRRLPSDLDRGAEPPADPLCRGPARAAARTRLATEQAGLGDAVEQ